MPGFYWYYAATQTRGTTSEARESEKQVSAERIARKAVRNHGVGSEKSQQRRFDLPAALLEKQKYGNGSSEKGDNTFLAIRKPAKNAGLRKE